MRQILMSNKWVNLRLSHWWHLLKKTSTQQLGDTPPGDDNYFDMEDEESWRGGGGGRNPNAPAWVPEKMELRSIVDRLL